MGKKLKQSVKKNEKIIKLIIGYAVFTVFFNSFNFFYKTTFAAPSSPPKGSVSVDIVDTRGKSVSAPKVLFGMQAFRFNTQNSQGILGTAPEKIRIKSSGKMTSWTLSIAPTGGPGALWTSLKNSYDFNDSKNDGTDDADWDNQGGQLTIDPAVGILKGIPDDATCSPSKGISKGSAAIFRETAPAVNSISLLSAGITADTNCAWNFTGVLLQQLLPPSQVSDTYSLSFTLTAI